jgi:diguanylate cyclase (GGDEF)-like protein/PAS domain S-box-containing protein
MGSEGSVSGRDADGFDATSEEAGEREGDLRASPQRFERALEHAAIGMALISPEGRWLQANGALHELVGYREEELLVKTLQDLTYPEDLNTDIEHLEQMLSGEIHSYQVEKRFLHKEGHVVWVLQSVSMVREGEGHPLQFVVLIQDITERKRRERRLTHLAYHDPLTGLSNSSLFLEQLEGALAKAELWGDYVAVLYLDLDGFKQVNDSLGYEVGDRLLVAVARRLESSVRSGEETIARLSGDEFCILVEGVAGTETVASVARRVNEALRRPFTINDHLISSVNVSIGITVKAPGESKTARQLLREADAAMYRAKKRGKDRYEVFESSMVPRILEGRRRLEEDLRQAVEGAGFSLHYQPKVSLKTGEIVGWEALVRWEHPEGRLVTPSEFVPLAEETGMIIPLGWWVLREACRQEKEWTDRYPGSAPMMNVNFSAHQFRHPALIEEVADVLEETGLEPSSLCMEITESTAMEDAPFTVFAFQELKELGVMLAIDDFGVGYSSLSYLKRFPVDTLKIDRSIIEGVDQDPGNTAIVSAAITLAHALNLEAVAEGVESEAEVMKLSTLGCDVGQGHYWWTPRPAHAAAALLEASLDA